MAAQQITPSDGWLATVALVAAAEAAQLCVLVALVVWAAEAEALYWQLVTDPVASAAELAALTQVALRLEAAADSLAAPHQQAALERYCCFGRRVSDVRPHPRRRCHRPA